MPKRQDRGTYWYGIVGPQEGVYTANTPCSRYIYTNTYTHTHTHTHTHSHTHKVNTHKVLCVCVRVCVG